MNRANFIKILQNPETITSQQTQEVKGILDEFPYFQSARSLYLKGLKNENSFKYNQELRVTAAYTTDRSILFDFITSKSFLQNKISEQIKQNAERLKDISVVVEDISVNKRVNPDNRLKQQIKDTEGVLDPELFQPKIEDIKVANQNKKTEEENTNTSPIIKTQDVLDFGKPFQFNKEETHSFNQWLKLARFTPIQRKSTANEKELDNITTAQKRKFELIDNFITKNPKIDPAKSITPKGNLAKNSMIQPEALMTETLARIYVGQGNYKKAIQSYKILSLKYPEKSGLFADQIKAIKQLQEQNNKRNE